jgi:hypothetical protein
MGAYPAVSSLAVGQSYTNSETVIIPPSAAGPYYIIVLADSGGELFNGRNESDNVGVSPLALFVTLPPPVDLAAGNVTISPADDLPGNPVTVTWKVVNLSAHSAPSTWTDAVYLSTNAVWEVTAMAVTNDNHSGLAAFGSYEDAWTGPLPGLTPGSYYAIVRTDVQNTLREPNLSNNVATSPNTLLADVPVLMLGQTVTNALSTGTEQYYKLNAPSDQTVQITLASALTNSANELYVRYGAVPDLGHYDFLYNNPLGADQQIQIPATQAGWYYILVRGGSVPNAPAPYALSAQSIPFSITAVTPSQIGDNGQVTLTLQGAKFQPDALVTLLGTNAAYFAATNIFVNANTVLARFQFTNTLHGTYDAVLTNPDGTAATNAEAVTIQASSGLEAEVMQGAVNLRPLAGLPFQWFGSVQNVGNVDLPFLTVSVMLTQPYPFTLTPPAAALLTGIDTNGNTNTLFARDLPPGASLPFSFVVSIIVQPFTYYIGPYAESTETLLAEVADESEMVRQGLLTATNTSRLPPAIATALQDSNAWLTLIDQTLVTAGLLDDSDLPLLSNVQARKARRLRGSQLKTARTSLTPNDDSLGCLVCNAFERANAAKDTFDAVKCIGEVVVAEELGLAKCVIDIVIDYPITYLEEKFCEATLCDEPPEEPPWKHGTPNPEFPEDPNEKVGPAGYSSAAFVSVQQPMTYTVYFANETNATAYVRQVGITDPLDPSLDILTFRLSEIAFGGVTITVPTNLAVYQTRVTLPPPNPSNVVVDVSAVVNPQSRSVSWTMNAIDLNTGQLITSAQEGLLPPDNTNHTGEGHVSYTITPKAGVATGTVVTNQAIIVFDTNEPIPTNPATNTVDGVLPVSAVAALPSVVV